MAWEKVPTGVLRRVQVCPWEPTDLSFSMCKMGLVPDSAHCAGITARVLGGGGYERWCRKRGGSLTNSDCGHGLHCRSEHLGMSTGCTVLFTSLLSVKVWPQTLSRGVPSSYSMGASSQPDTVTVCGPWERGVTGGWNCVSRSVDSSVQ